MRVFQPYGTRERLVEMMKKVNNLNESLLPREKKNEIVKDFIKFAGNKLNFENYPKVTISYNDKEASEMSSFGKFTPSIEDIRVVAANRNLADVLRTLAHELIHYKQNKEGRLDNNSSKTGSEIENEANAQAGVIMRNFAMENPIIFE